MKKNNLPKIIIDTDPGHDDVMALLLAIQSNRLDIQAVTTVCGNSTIDNTTKNAQYALNLLQSAIPLYSGALKPLHRALIQAVVHGVSGLDGIDATNSFQLTRNASSKIIDIVREFPKEITIITLGPLTNVAQAIIKNPIVMRLVKEVIIMGGAVRVPGNKNRVAEFNIFVDPDAADIVFQFPLKKFLVPLDACNHVRLHLNDFERIKNIKLQQELVKMVKPFINNIHQDEGIKAALMYDPLTVFYFLFPEYSKTEFLNIQIEIKGELTRGMTVADLRKKPSEPGNVTLVTHIDAEKFRKYFIETLSK